MADPQAVQQVSPVIVAVDQGTSSTKAIVVDDGGVIVAAAVVPVGLQLPAPGWVEQDPAELADSVLRAIEQATAGIEHRVAGIGLSSQRESALIWDRSSGKPLGPLLGWQDRRTTSGADELAAAGHGDRVQGITGLPIDPMFSALKLAWLLDEVDPDRSRAGAGEIAVGTVDSWLLFRLTGEHRIEAGNASRTQLFSLETLDWDDELLALFRVPRAALPTIVASNAPSAPVTALPALPHGTRVHAVLGDSHAALYAHGVRTPGMVKATYGTGSSIMGLLPAGQPVDPGLVTTIAWMTDAPAYAFEGNILSSGSTLVWLAELLSTTPGALCEIAETASADHGINLVPAFAGLGAPWWDDAAQAILTGFTLGTTRNQLARAAVESIALQIEDVLSAADTPDAARIARILVDGGPSANDWLMQVQANLSQRIVERPDIAELSALGVAHLAGVGAGVWTDHDVLAFPRGTTAFTPALDPAEAAERRRGWSEAVSRARTPTPASVIRPLVTG
jgi:glycerol kinase